MSSLRDIRQHLKAIESIKKITDTMERIAAVKLRHAQARAEDARPYTQYIKEILLDLASSDMRHPLFEHREVKKVGVVIMAGDRGLSGSYNAHILSTADKFLKNYPTEQLELFLLGRKAIDHYRKKNWKIRFELTPWMEKSSIDLIEQFSKQLVDSFLSKELDEIWLIYTHFISVMKRNVIAEKFLNIESLKIEKNKLRKDFILEPNLKEIIDVLLPRYCMTQIQSAFYESYAAEIAARIIAMQAASKNSEELIERLTLVKNKTRQRDITKEMIEIISGAGNLR